MNPMSIDEIIRIYSSERGAMLLAVLLAVGLWAARRSGLTKNLTTIQEISAVLPAAISYVLAGIYSGRSVSDSLVFGALVFLAPMKWNTNPLPAEK